MRSKFGWDTRRALVMGVLNVTPDSFSDGGEFVDVDRAVDHGRAMARAGADIIDVGGESTRPGAAPVSVEEELERVIPVIEKLTAGQIASASMGQAEVDRKGLAAALNHPKQAPSCIVSVDTTKAFVAEAALTAGACIVNDIGAMRYDARMVEVVRDFNAGVVLMHMKGRLQTMQQDPHYNDVVNEVRAFLDQRIVFALQHGVSKDQIAIDPGIGFGKTVEHNLTLLAHLVELRSLGCPIAVGTSRKSFIGKVLGRGIHERLWGTAATVAWAMAQGAQILRVHDIAEMTDVVRMCDALRRHVQRAGS